MDPETQQQLDDLRELVNSTSSAIAELQGRRMGGINHMMGRNPLSAKYAALGSQTLISIKAGKTFNDTLGRFFPVVVNPTGGLTLNASTAFPNSLTFHNTAVSVSDVHAYVANDGVLRFDPNSASSTNFGLLVKDRTGTPYMGVLLNAAYTSGGHTGPSIAFIDPAGTSTTILFNGVAYSNLQSNGANYITVAGAAAGSRTAIGALGSDTNIDISINPKGTGVVNIGYGTVALGGGAAPTLGTIGGTGPQFAAQNGWFQISMNGTKYWIPVWR